MKLYVDSVLAATNPATGAQSNTGYWRVGGDRTFGGTTSNYVNGHHRRGRRVPVGPAGGSGRGPLRRLRPAAAEQAAHGRLHPHRDLPQRGGRRVHLDRQDGTIASYAWNFGDGTTGTGAHGAAHVRRGGHLTVTLTVTDDRGATATTTPSRSRWSRTRRPPRPSPTPVVPRPRGRRRRFQRSRRDDRVLRVGLR